MEVTRTNFEEVLPIFKRAVDDCAFMSIDTEFSGLTSGKAYSNDRLDDLNERWAKLRDAGQNFLPIQVGVSCFQWDSNKSAYNSKEFNFYVFPRPAGRERDSRFMVQASCMAFLAEHNFDFNKWIHGGISYVSLEQEARMKSEIRRQRERSNSNEGKIKLKRESDVKFVNEQTERVSAWKKQSGNKDPIVLEACNAFLRRALRESLEASFDKIFVDTVPGSGFHSCIRVHEADMDEADRLKNEADEKRVKEIEEAVGFTNAVKYISASGKPVVGHNCLMDLIYSYAQYCGPLPERIQDFKKNMKTFLPHIYDTKFIAENNFAEGTFPQTDLESLFKQFTENENHVRVEHAEGFDRYVNDEAAHEAGYDAYMTGVVYVNLMQMSEVKNAENSDVNSVTSSTRSMTRSRTKRMRKEPQLTIMKKDENKVFLMHSDIGHINFGGMDPVPDRKNVFCLSPVPIGASIPSMKGTFERFGMGNFFIKWVDQSTAYIVFNDAFDEIATQKFLNQAHSMNLNLMRYVDYQSHAVAHEMAMTGEYEQQRPVWSRCDIS